MKKLFVYSLAVAAIASVASCKKKDDSPATTAKVIFMNGCINSDKIDATVDGSKVSNASSMSYLNKTSYLDIKNGTYSVGYLLSSTQINLIKNTATFTTNQYYSVFTGGAVNVPSLVITSDDLTAPSAGKAKVRLVNLSVDSLNESLIIGSTIASGVGYPSASSFVEIAAGTNTVLVQDPAPANAGKIATLPAQNFAAGKIYTIVVTGTSAIGTSAPMTLTLINNN